MTILSLLCIAYFVAHTLSQELEPSEYSALHDLYNATNGAEWTWYDPFTDYGYPWNFTDSSDPCLTPWQGLTCVVSGTSNHITELTFSGNNMIGTLPNSLGNLTKLQLLHLTFNDLHGTIPHVIGDLTQLKVLELFQNDLDGAIPSMKELRSLTTLALGSNKLSGTIPREIGNTALIALLLGNNHLTGPIPTSIEDLTEIEQIYIGYNFLTGTISNALGDLIGLEALVLTDNLFNGTIPYSFENLTHIKTLSASYNHLTGTVPDLFVNMNDLAVFDINSNHLHGTIAQSLWNTSIVEVLMQDNLISGSVLDQIGYATMLRFINISNNIITGTIPHAIGSLYQLDYLSGMKNKLSGTLPRTIGKLGKLSGLYLRGNQLSGISSACLHGTFPDNICEATELITLVLYGLSTGASCTSTRSFEGTLPRCLLTLPKIRTLLMSSNRLSNTMSDDWVVNNKTLIQLDLCHNQLRGVIPSAIQNRSWSLLDLSNNKFSGELSKGLDLTPVRNLTRLFQYEELINTTTFRKDFKPRLTLEVNRLSGKVPNSIKSMTDLSVLAGNLFQCRYDKTDLPQHDSDVDEYECASNSFNLSIYLWLGLTAAAVVLLYMYLRTYQMSYSVTWSVQIPEVCIIQMPHLCSVLSVYGDIFKVAGHCTAFCLLVLLPYYLLISHYSGTHTHHYIYVQRVQTSEVDNADTIDYATVAALRYVSVVYTSANVVVVLGINIAFVFIVLYETSVAQTIAQSETVEYLFTTCSFFRTASECLKEYRVESF
eukprot:gene10241-11988_t